MGKIAGVSAAFVLAVGGCAQVAGGGDVAKPRSATGKLDLLNAGEVGWDSYVPASTPAEWGRNLDLDRAIPGSCRPDPPPPRPSGFLPPLVAAAAPVVAGWVIDYLIAQATSAAQKRLAEYSAVTAGGLKFGSPKQVGFYGLIDPPYMPWKCVRLVHMIKGNSGEMLAMEAIVKIEVAGSQDSLLITPLRLYFDRPVARTGSAQDSSFGVSLGMTFDALWQASGNGEGKTARTWNVTALSQKIEGINWKDDSLVTIRQRFYYYNLGSTPLGDKSDNSNKPIQVPLVPWSVNKKAPYGSGTLTATLAEVGDPPAILEFAAVTLKDHGKDIGDFLKDAAKKAIPADAPK